MNMNPSGQVSDAAGHPTVGRQLGAVSSRFFGLILLISMFFSLSLPSFAEILGARVRTIPSNGDTNPYGIIFVFGNVGGSLMPGDLLVANFNNSGGVMGLGTTIVDIRNGVQLPKPFYTATTELEGLNPLRQLGSSFIVGNVPLTTSTTEPAGPGALTVLNSSGDVTNTITDPNEQFINGPWGLLTKLESQTVATVFVSNVVNGTVWRLQGTYGGAIGFKLTSETQIGGGYAVTNTFPTAINGPAGLAYNGGPKDILYVASEADNEIFAIDNASTRTTTTTPGTLVYSDSVNLHGPTGLRLLPNGDLVTANDDGINVVTPPLTPSALVEFNPVTGKFVADYQVDPNPGGAFGVTAQVKGNQVLLGYDDDNTDSASVLSFFFQ
jgi:hypothetical protein